MRRHPLLLVALAPAIAELASGSTPLPLFVRPGVLAAYTGLYGLGALLIREVAHRRQLGYGGVLLLGAAYGALEEGILLKSWYDPTWMGAQLLAPSIRIAGVSLLQPALNVVYHAVFSITAPILIADAVAGSREPWLTRRTRIVLSVLFLLTAWTVARTFNPAYTPAGWQYLLAWGAVLLFTAWALLRPPRSRGDCTYPPGRLWLYGVPFMTVVALIFYGLADAGVSWVAILMLAGAYYGLTAHLFRRMDWTRADRRHYLAAGAGLVTGLLPFVLLSTRRDPAKAGNVLAAILLLLLVAGFYRKVAGEPHAAAPLPLRRA